MTDPGSGDDAGDRLQLLSREELEQRVRRRTSDLDNLMNTMVDVLLELDADGRVRMANDAVHDVLGYEEDEIVGKPVDVLFASPEDADDLSSVTTNGQLIDRLLSAGHVTDVEVRLSTAAGDAIPMSLSASIMDDGNGGFDGIVCVAKDVSERVAAQRRAEFLHSLLRHDLGNKLQVTKGYLDLLADEADLPERQAEFLADALTGVEEATELIENVRMVNSIDGTEAPEPVDLDTVVTEAVTRHEDLRKRRGMAIDVDLDDDVRVLAGSLLKELFSNLVENALVHSGGDRIRITDEITGDAVRIRIEDDGAGVPAAERDRVMEKGYAGRGSSGSGLGMYLARQIATTYGGDVAVGDSDLGGARFDVTLQRAEDGASSSSA